MMPENQMKTKSSGLNKRWITENLGLKVISVFLAGFLWYLVNFTGSSTKDLRVIPNLTGQPANGLVVDSVGITPETIIAEGIKRFLEDEKEVVTKLVDIEGISRDTTFETKLDIKGMGYRIHSETITLTVKLRRKEE